MGWFYNDPPPPPPAYSELGEELYRLLEEKEGECKCRCDRYARKWEYGIAVTNRLFLQLNRDDDKDLVRVSEGGEGVPLLNRLMTNDDLQRIHWRAWEMMRASEKRRDYEEMKQALERIKPNPFDRDCRELARCVLKGDASAARPLIDKCIERIQDGM